MFVIVSFFCFCFVFVLTYSNFSCWWWRPQLFAMLGLGGSSWPPGWWWQVDLALINPEKDRVCLNNTAPGQMFGQAEQTVGKQPACQFWGGIKAYASFEFVAISKIRLQFSPIKIHIFYVVSFCHLKTWNIAVSSRAQGPGRSQQFLFLC